MTSLLSTRPQIVSLDYYDGAIEGVASSLIEGSDCYFKLLAWDGDQDKRMYCVVKIDSSDFLFLLSVAEEKSVSPLSQTIMLEWCSLSAAEKEQIDVLVERSRRKFKFDGYLVFASQITADKSFGILKVDAKISSRVESLLYKGAPDEIENWQDVHAKILGNDGSL